MNSPDLPPEERSSLPADPEAAEAPEAPATEPEETAEDQPRPPRPAARPVTTEEVHRAVMAGGTIKGAACEGLSFSRRTVPSDVTFELCDLTELNLKRAEFKGKLVFRRCTLDNPSFAGAIFEQGVAFLDCELKNVWRKVTGVRCNGHFALRNCTVSGKLHLDGTTFAQRCDLWDSNFHGWVDFDRVTFEREADLRSADFHHGLVFKRCTFKGDVLLRGTTVHKKLAFDETEVAGTLDLAKAKLHDFTYLEGLRMGPRAGFSFWNCIARALLVKPPQVAGRLASEREGNHGTAAEEYGVLKSNYAGLNWFDEEDWAYYQFKRARWQARAAAREGGFLGGVSRVFERLIFDWGCGYGTMPMRVLASAVVVILFFALLYCVPLATHGIPGYDASGPEPHLKSYKITGNQGLDAVTTALVDSTSAFVSGFDGVDKNVEGWLAIALTLEGLSGMLLLGLFIVSFSRKVIR